VFVDVAFNMVTTQRKHDNRHTLSLHDMLKLKASFKMQIN